VTTDSLRIASGRARGIKEKLIASLIAAGRGKIVSNVINMIDAYSSKGKKIVIVAPPFLVEVLLSSLEAKGKKLELGKNGWLITAGGWKLPTGGAILGEQWRQRVEAILGIPPLQCRDGYGMSEGSAFYPECEGHYKHIPHSIIYPFLLDDELKPAKEGDFGRLAFLDPIPDSYPGFILTGDRVKILKSCPACDRPTPVFDHDISRIGGVEDRGCAEIARELVSHQLEKTVK